MPRELLGGLWVALGSVFFGVVVVLGKVSSEEVPVVSALAIRFWVAALVLGVALAATGGTLRPARGEGRRLVALGVFGYGVEAALFFLAIERGSATTVTLLFFVYPVIVTALSALLGRGLPGALVVGSLVAAVAGTALVVVSSGAVDVSSAGIAFALGAATVYALYLLGAEATLRRTSSLAGAMTVAAAAGTGLAAYSVLSGTGALPVGDEWAPVLGMGVSTAGAFACLFAGLRLLGAVRTAIIAALEPLSAAMLAALFLDESLRALTLVGGALILAGATAASAARARRPEPETAMP